MLFSQTHDFVEALPAVIATDRVSLVVPDMAIRGNEYTNRVGSYMTLLALTPGVDSIENLSIRSWYL